jgi:putative sterol carrier protein
VPKHSIILTMSLDHIKQQIQQKLTKAPQIGAKIKFDFGDDGVIHVDAIQNPAVMTENDEDADTTLVCSVETFQNILSGTQDPNIAFMMGKLKVKGSMGYAMKLNGILED